MPRVTRRFGQGLVIILVLWSAANTAAARAPLSPIPPRSIRIADNHYRARSFRRAVLHVRRFIRARAGDVTRIPIYRRRGVTVARFVSRDPATPWLAIHVYEVRGTPYIYIVQRPKRP